MLVQMVPILLYSINNEQSILSPAMNSSIRHAYVLFSKLEFDILKVFGNQQIHNNHMYVYTYLYIYIYRMYIYSTCFVHMFILYVYMYDVENFHTVCAIFVGLKILQIYQCRPNVLFRDS